MPSKYSVLTEYSLLYKRVWGRYTEDDNQAAHRERYGLSQQMDLNGYAEIQDLTDVTQYEISVEKMQALARQYKQLSESDRESGRFVARKLAYVAPDSVAFGTARIYDALTDSTGINFKVFRDIEPAIEWLELPSAALQKISDIRHQQEKDGLLDN